MGLPGLPELLVIFGIAVLLFGSKKLPSLGGAIGESIKNFKKGLSEAENEKIASNSKDSKSTDSSNDSSHDA
ncbi:MAG: twin-arginine translocase TatA/TatE family subunit [Oligoflexales bacterium]